MKEQDIKRIAIIGAGLMGLGVGVEFARFGYEVSLYNTREESSKKAMERAKKELDLFAETDLISKAEAEAAYERLRPTTDLEDAAAEADFVHESVLEVLQLKQDIFAKLDKICPPPAILATNTSGLRVSKIASGTKHPERVVAAHYFQPPHCVPLVEVAGFEDTSPEVIETTVNLLRGLRKKAVVINFEIPGFVGNRIQGVIAREIRSLVDKGVCSPETIDNVISFGFGRRMAYSAYFKRQDLIGLDFIATQAKDRGWEIWGPIAERLKRGEYGMKSGKGFYDWPGDSAEKFQRKEKMELIRLMKKDMAEGLI